jgi:Tfp pilus assembly protein PilO
MGRIPTWAVILIGVFLLAGVGALVFMLMIKPERERLADLQTQLQAQTEIANRLDATKARLEEVTEQWLQAQDQVQALREARSIPISFGHPAGAMIALWYEYRHDLVPLIEDWVRSTGCTIESGATFPAPPMTPPTAPASGFMQIPAEQPVALTVSGTLQQIERLYRSLDQFPRVVTISDLVLMPTGEGDRLQAPINLAIYLLVEAPAAPAAAAPAAGGMEPGMDPAMMDPGMSPDAAPMEEAPPDPGMDPGAGSGDAELDI